jgi:radical SAM protein with 4Fe4S-binding SPASM domain
MLKIERTEPLCTAPFTAFLVDPNKNVKPCCNWCGLPLGNIERSTFQEIKDDSPWRKMVADLKNHIWPQGCLACKYREELTGWSVRSQFVRGGTFFNEQWNDGITYLEFNDSNICNLACLHCSSAFSTSWRKQDEAIGRSSSPVHGPNPQVVRDILRNIDDRLERLMIKGGEPFLNTDVVLLLEELDNMKLLQKLRINIVTNGSQPYSPLAQRIHTLLGKARSVGILLSIDGVGEVQKYIRHGKGSDIGTIETFIKKFLENGNTDIALLTSITALNVFYLDQLAAWWQSLPYKSLSIPSFKLFVLQPEFLSLASLTEQSRLRLASRYESNSLYEMVVGCLRKAKTNDHLRKHLSRYIKAVDQFRGTDCFRSIPAFANDLYGHRVL